MRTLEHRRIFAGAVGVLLLTAACSGSGAEVTDSSADGGGGETVVVNAIDYGYENVPASVAAGTKFELRNDSEVEVHELVAVRLPDDETRPVSELVALPPEEMEAFFPLVKTVLVAPPGESGMAVEGDGSLAEPGRYLIICAIPTGADPAEFLAAVEGAEGGPPDVAGGPPHLVQGMFAELTVEG